MYYPRPIYFLLYLCSVKTCQYLVTFHTEISDVGLPFSPPFVRNNPGLVEYVIINKRYGKVNTEK